MEKFSQKQLTAMTWWGRRQYKDLDGIVCDGAVRSGKTMAATCGFFLWSMLTFQDQVFALCGKSVGSLRRNLIYPMHIWLGGLVEITDNRAENKLTVRMGDKVNTFYLFGGLDESSYMLIQGITLAGVLLDEVVLMPRSFVEQALARCSVKNSKMWFTCNPGPREHWFYREMICKAEEKKLLRLSFTMQDNPSLTEEVKARYQRLYSGVFYRRFVLGQWCAAEGRIYDFDPEKDVVDPETHLKNAEKWGGRWYISVDYGVQNPFSAGLWCVVGGVALRVKEFYHDGRQSGRLFTDEDYYDALVSLAGGRSIERIIIDPSAASMVALIRKKGRFSVRKADNRVLPGIRLVGSLLQKGQLKIAPCCKDAIREFSLYCWQDDLSKDAPKKENDHAMDDIRYFCMSVMGRGS